MAHRRYLEPYIEQDLSDKMVFVGGPRQVGKTTLATDRMAGFYSKTAYFNWDNRNHRRAMMQGSWPTDAELLIFDEIHKYKKWQSFIKGEYDTAKSRHRFLVTGSARLDVFRKGGDTMLGRYRYYHLHPFSLAEVTGTVAVPSIFEALPLPDLHHKEGLAVLERFGGFPEPFLKQSQRTLRRWHREKRARLLRDDIRDLTRIRDLAGLQLLVDMLPDRVASLLSANSLREDLEVSHRAVTNWLAVLEAFYYCYRIYPYADKRYRSLKKEPKLYLYDWSEIEDEGARFENCVASHLFKLVHFLQDYEGYRADLHYLRSIEKKEVDFLVTVEGKPWFAVEVKLSNRDVSPHLLYFRQKLNIPFCYQVLQKGGIDQFSKEVRVVSADRFLACLI